MSDWDKLLGQGIMYLLIFWFGSTIMIQFIKLIGTWLRCKKEEYLWD